MLKNCQATYFPIKIGALMVLESYEGRKIVKYRIFLKLQGLLIEQLSAFGSSARTSRGARCNGF